MVDGDEDALGRALPDGDGHPRRHLAEQGIRNDNTDRTDDDIRTARADDDRILAGSAAVCARLEHAGCRQRIRADSGDLDVRHGPADLRDQLSADHAALSVND